jgi:hypothetical protein
MALPSEVDRVVAGRLFADIQRLGWEDLTNVERSAQYVRWLADPDIGGRLTQFMDAGQARVWIKDGPVKEYPRAAAGVGKYATLVVTVSTQLPSLIVSHALGSGWLPRAETMQVKPLRIAAYAGEEEAVVAWGPARDLKHLVWAALLAQVRSDAREWVLVVTSTFTNPVPAAEKVLHGRIGSRIGVRIVHVELR